MLRAYTVAAVRAAEAALMAQVPEGELMRRAARGLAEALHFIHVDDDLLVLVGPGDNGGDALFAAALLAGRGVRVQLCALDIDTVHRSGLAAALAAGAEIVDEPSEADFVLDGLFGIGARAGLGGRSARLAEAVRGRDVIAVDLPSGVDVDTGAIPGTAVSAETTITFGAYKICHFVGPAGQNTPIRPWLVDIGLQAHLPQPDLEVIDRHDWHIVARHLFTGEVSHKYTRGVVGIAAGSEQYAGAAHLCVAGAQAGPAGMVRFLGSPELDRRVVDRAPEVVAGEGRCQAWVVGPGTGDDAASRLERVLSFGVPVVVDADALAHIPDSFDVPALLTPHAGELAAMLGIDRDEVEADPWTHVHRAAERWQCSVLLKGERTVVATPGLPTRANTSGTPWLGTAGSGDVLAGFAGSLMAAGLSAHDAGSVGAFLHGLAGERCSRGGPFTASDVAAALPGELAEFLSAQRGGIAFRDQHSPADDGS